MMKRPFMALLGSIAVFTVANPCAAQQTPIPPNSAIYLYADVADLALASTVVTHAKMRKSERLRGKLATGVALGRSRHLVTVDILSLIKAPAALAKRQTYIIDIPSDSSVRRSVAENGEMVVFAQQGRPGELRLVAPDSHIAFSPELAQMVRAILTEANRASAPPRVTGISSAFHAPGNIAGDSETQIFLDAEGDRPVSLNIRRRAESAPIWFAATGDTVDENAPPPKRNSLSWYRLACFLPRDLPAAAIESLTPESAEAVRTDYRLVIEAMGGCRRARTKPAT